MEAKAHPILNQQYFQNHQTQYVHIQATLPNVKLVSHVRNKSIYTFQLEYDNNKDPREDIFKYALKNKWTVLKMSPKTTDLEAIFRDLTTNGAADA